MLDTPAVIVQPLSFPLKPKPSTPTLEPGRTTLGLTVTWAIGVPTVKVADAAAPVLSVTVIT
jgi:hypothetical protein